MEVLPQGFTSRPRSTAFWATSPAPTMTEGFEVLVQLVMAAMTMDPSPISTGTPSYSSSW